MTIGKKIAPVNCIILELFEAAPCQDVRTQRSPTGRSARTRRRGWGPRGSVGPGAGAMGMLETLKPIIKLLLFATYGVYCVVGLVMFIVGAYYYGTIDGASASAVMVCIVAGLVMIAVGGAAIFASMKEDKTIMTLCLILNFVLFVCILGATMVGLFLVNEIEDPVESAVKKVYDQTQFRMSGWGAVVQAIPRGGPHACMQLRDSIDAASSAPRPVADEAVCRGLDDGSQPASCVKAHDEQCVATLAEGEAEGATTCELIANVDPVAEACEEVYGWGFEEAAFETVCELTSGNPEPCALINEGATGNCTHVAEVENVDGDCTRTAGTGDCDYQAEPVCGLTYARDACENQVAGECEYTAGVPTACALNEAGDACAVQGGNCVFYDGQSSYLLDSWKVMTGNMDSCPSDGRYGTCQGFQGALAGGNSNQQGKLAGNCTLVHELMDGESGEMTAYQDECEACWLGFEVYTVDKIKGQLWPATYTALALFIFVCLLLVLNNWMVNNCVGGEDDEETGKWKPEGAAFIAGCVLNGIVLLFGLLTIILGAVANSDLNEGCDSVDGGADCVNWACISIIVLGCFFFVVAGFSTGGLVMGGFLGRNIVRISNLCLVFLAFFLMLAGIAFAIVAGAITSINEEYDLKFEKIRAQYEQADCNICADGDDVDGDGCSAPPLPPALFSLFSLAHGFG